jgi:hypothetical protein
MGGYRHTFGTVGAYRFKFNINIDIFEGLYKKVIPFIKLAAYRTIGETAAGIKKT